MAIILIVMLIGICCLVWFTLFKTYKNATGVHTEKKLNVKISELTTEKSILESELARLEQVVESIQSYTDTYKQLVNNRKNNYSESIQRIIEAICSDLKMTSKNRHRAGFWFFFPDEGSSEKGKLKLLHGSAGFPDSTSGEKMLCVNNSVAGRAFRKKTIEIINNLNDDPDWNEENSSYNSILCLPVGDYGVITLDAKDEITSRIVEIVKLYAELIEGIYTSYQEYEINKAITSIEDEEIADITVQLGEVAATSNS